MRLYLSSRLMGCVQAVLCRGLQRGAEWATAAEKRLAIRKVRKTRGRAISPRAFPPERRPHAGCLSLFEFGAIPKGLGKDRALNGCNATDPLPPMSDLISTVRCSPA